MAGVIVMSAVAVGPVGTGSLPLHASVPQPSVMLRLVTAAVLPARERAVC